MTFWLILPIALSVLSLAAHFFRHGESLMCLASLASLGLVLVKRPWAARALQGILITGGVVWLQALLEIAHLRQSLGQPWLRLALILGAVIALSLGSALLVQTRRLKQRFGLSHPPSGK